MTSSLYQVLSAMSALKMIKYLYAKLLYLFGLASNNPGLGESVWRSVSSESGVIMSEQDIKQSGKVS